ncbi:MAG: carbohydrate-binding module family 14 protein [Rikenellaceae bacterium]|nr:carbohydrate-binding module family 14 protein [Rikenellaceae bacterium]MCL2691917.1 carbohydrate-binding module family 14 protein [Rikenellaceae bacterium]
MIKTLISKLTPKTTLNKVNLALTGLFCVMLAGNIYMKAKMDGLYFPDPENCGAYFEYENGVKVRKCCYEGLLFCPQLQYCVFPGDPNCTFDCLESGPPCVPGPAGNGNGGTYEDYKNVGKYTVTRSGSGGVTIEIIEAGGSGGFTITSDVVLVTYHNDCVWDRNKTCYENLRTMPPIVLFPPQ